MTFKEKLTQEFPTMVNPVYVGGCSGCPSSYDYEPDVTIEGFCGKGRCKDCWDREIPEEVNND